MKLEYVIFWTLFLLPTCFASWAIKKRLKHSKITVYIVGIWSIVLGFFFCRNYSPAACTLSFDNWLTGIILFACLESVQLILINPKFSKRESFTVCIRQIIFYLVIIGFVEEFWFRGIWFAMFSDYNAVWAIIIGSLLFALIHYINGGVNAVVLTFFIGIAFSTARYYGTSILVLTVVHGWIDYLNCKAFSGSNLRYSTLKSNSIAVAGILLTVLLVVLINL
ncbi:MAG: CPBP family intramembrane glutamic endopeptidase [Sedimentisphaeraceae bacterium JB056]